MNELKCPKCNSSNDLIIEQPHWGSKDNIIDLYVYCITCDINFETTGRVIYHKPKKSNIQENRGYSWSA